MNLSRKWLSEFVTVDANDKDFAEAMTLSGSKVETYEDHRMAMAFSLIGLKTGKIGIRNPGCCRKTFENYFELIEELQENNHAGSAEQ